MTRRCLLIATVILTLPAAAGAQTVYWCDRPLVMPKGQREANIDLSVGLNKGALGEDFGIGAGLAGDRYSGLHFRIGVLKNFEMGMSLQYLFSMHMGEDYLPRGPVPVDPSRLGRFSDVSGAAAIDSRPSRRNPGPEGDGTHRMAGYPYKFSSDNQNHLNPLQVYFRYAFIPQLALDFALIVPTEPRDGMNRPSFRLGLPFKWVLSPGLLSIHVEPDILIGFAKKGPLPTEPKETVLISYFADAGITLNLAGAFLDISLGYGGDAYPYKRGYFPMSVLLGYTIFPTWDLYAGVSLDNLVPKTGKADDARRLTLGTSVRF